MHFISNKNATIYSIVTRAGTAIVKKGDLVNKGDILVLGQNEIMDDNGEVKEILYFTADAQIWGDVIYEYIFPISEIEIVSLKIADVYDDNSLLSIGYRKLEHMLTELEMKDVIILDACGEIIKEENRIYFHAKIQAREQIGINIPVEEVRENEFE